MHFTYHAEIIFSLSNGHWTLQIFFAEFFHENWLLLEWCWQLFLLLLYAPISMSNIRNKTTVSANRSKSTKNNKNSVTWFMLCMFFYCVLSAIPISLFSIIDKYEMHIAFCFDYSQINFFFLKVHETKLAMQQTIL